MKGGVGKTTSVVNVAQALSDLGKRTLLVDCDPQFNATTYIMSPFHYEQHLSRKKTTYDLFQNTQEDFSIVSSQIRLPKSISPNELIFNPSTPWTVHIIPSALNLALVGRSSRRKEDVIKNIISAMGETYEIILLDCPPTASVFSEAALLASDHYVIPVKPDNFSTIGLPLVNRWIEDLSKVTHHSPNFLGIIINMRLKGNGDQDQIIARLQNEYPNKLFKSTIYECEVFNKSVTKRIPVTKHDRISRSNKVNRDRAKTSLHSIANEIIRRTSP